MSEHQGALLASSREGFLVFVLMVTVVSRAGLVLFSPDERVTVVLSLAGVCTVVLRLLGFSGLRALDTGGRRLLLLLL